MPTVAAKGAGVGVLWALCLLAAAAPSATAGAVGDPTVPLIQVATDWVEIPDGATLDAGEPRLTSIIHAPDRRMAIINGMRVRERSRIGDYEVTHIGPRAVTLSGPEGERTLRIVRTSIKRTGSHEVQNY